MPSITLPDFSHEDSFGLASRVAGVDEAGRGCWAGPVVAAVVILPKHGLPDGINDSKQLSAGERARLASQLREIAEVAVGMASAEEIDRINILQASLLAMQRAVEALSAPPGHVLVDGNRLPRWPYPSTALVEGDAKSLSIAAASIIAKVTRDTIMAELAAMHPEYGWETNMGYGTLTHRRAIADHGITPHHRKSYRPIRQRIEDMLLA
ncbi:MAG: ribonuclease HII [Alphaproteobacteria bacterium]|nr:ribonuclease HII [Alphaproteobacteria bacterium]